MPKRQFIVAAEAWYARHLGSRKPEISLGEYYADGRTAGEFLIVWYDLGDEAQSPRLQCFDDGWSILFSDAWADFRGMLEGFANRNPTVREITDGLKRIGIEDATPRERP